MVGKKRCHEERGQRRNPPRSRRPMLWHWVDHLVSGSINRRGHALYTGERGRGQGSLWGATHASNRIPGIDDMKVSLRRVQVRNKVSGYKK